MSKQAKRHTRQTRQTMSTSQAAEQLQISVGQVRRLIEAGALRAINIGSSPDRRTWRLTAADLDRFRAQRTNDGGERRQTTRRRRRAHAALELAKEVAGS